MFALETFHVCRSPSTLIPARTSGRRVKHIVFCSPLLRRLAGGAFEPSNAPRVDPRNWKPYICVDIRSVSSSQI